MAKVTIVIEDKEGKEGCDIDFVFEPPLDSRIDMTAAQRAAGIMHGALSDAGTMKHENTTYEDETQ